jgi:hypothetical protein
MTRPLAVAVREGLQIRRVDGRTLSMQSQTADKGDPKTWSLGVRKVSRLKTNILLNVTHRPLLNGFSKLLLLLLLRGGIA